MSKELNKRRVNRMRRKAKARQREMRVSGETAKISVHHASRSKPPVSLDHSSA